MSTILSVLGVTVALLLMVSGLAVAFDASDAYKHLTRTRRMCLASLALGVAAVLLAFFAGVQL